MITTEQLVSIMPFSKGRASLFTAPLNAAMEEFSINTLARQAAFLAQIGHESGQLRYVKELASGEAYEMRKDLGNNVAGDGIKYKGRGLIQVTGKTNYTLIMLALNLPCLEYPEMLEAPENACRASAWWWKEHGLNELADMNTMDSFVKITRRINGGINGLADREALYIAAKNILKV